MSVPQQTAARVAEVGRRVYPDVDVPLDILAGALPEDADARPDAADLFLAAAVLHGVPAAMRAFDRVLADVRPALRGVVLDHDIDEVLQEVRLKLVVGSGSKPPPLAGYGGKGPLRAWVRVAVLRAGLDRRRRASPETMLDENAWLALASDAPDPALAMTHASLGPLVRSAIERAMRRLEPREQLILRQHLVDGLGAPELAALHGVHRVTTFRWLATIRQRFLEEIRETLATELAIGTASLDRVMRELRASVVPTVERLLRAPSQGA